ncbi:VWA domain-containing protein [Bacillus sp. CGMCC 1.16541]|uniref:VWA domain-containing protein n=1 Tax=Bacillus sp. CGMCC 1.16541 TaxID=2185143 RepID=UPI000D72A23C|nr:VWA domain-containing protein [Bacillus sp. CGMCC 1.16541]
MTNYQNMPRWRLILGEGSRETFTSYDEQMVQLTDEQQLMDEALAAIYDNTDGSSASMGSSLKLAKWLGDVRTFFPQDVVSVIQRDAIERKGLTQLLFEPETMKHVKPSIEMVATLLSLKGKIPERTKDTARELVQAVVEDIRKRLEQDIRQAVKGALNRQKHSPLSSGLQSVDWQSTIRRNLRHYNKEYQMVIPERFYFFERARQSNHWTVIVDIDQSASMGESIIYASIVSSIFASIPALKTHVVAFDTDVVDLTEQCEQDPVDMLFGIQLGGGTDINKSIGYCESFITDPAKTLFILISDLEEGGNRAGMIRRLREMHEAGVKVISLLALSDEGVPYYDQSNANQLAKIGIPCFGCTPSLLPDLLEDALKGKDLREWATKSYHSLRS